MVAGEKPTGLPKENIMEFRFSDGSKLIARPSGQNPNSRYISLQGPGHAVCRKNYFGNGKEYRCLDLQTNKRV
jgi:hypothetical protein